MSRWDPWRGCRRYSEGCRYCYIHKGDARRGVDTSVITQTARFYAPAERNKKGEYKMKPGQLVYLCFSTDFLIEEADGWRGECWKMIRERQDLHFMFLTKRIERFEECMPEDWENGENYPNITVGCTVENQRTADIRLSVLDRLPIKHKNIICQPMLERIDVSRHLDGVELVVAGGESDKDARPMDYAWVLDLREQCAAHNVSFQFRQCGTHFIKDGREYLLKTRELCSQARKAGIDFRRAVPEQEPAGAPEEEENSLLSGGAEPEHTGSGLPEGFYIRKAKEGDADAVFALYSSLIGTEGCVWSREYPLKSDAESDIAEDGLYLVCDRDSIPVAAASAGRDSGQEELSCWSADLKNTCAVTRLGVRAECQHRGVASVLLRYIERDAARRGFDGIRLLAHGGNKSALSLYDRAGYARVGSAEMYGLGTYICFEKRLPAEREDIQ